MKKATIFSLLIAGALTVTACGNSEKAATTSTNETAAAQQTQKGSVGNVQAEELKQQIGNENVIILDVRTPEELQRGIVEGAVNIDFYSSDFKSKALELDASKEVYIICHSGRRSASAASILAENGYNVKNVLGGMSAWQQKGLPTVQP